MKDEFGMFADPEPKVYESFPDPPEPEPDNAFSVPIHIPGARISLGMTEDMVKAVDEAFAKMAGSFAMMGRAGTGKSIMSALIRMNGGIGVKSFAGNKADMVCFDDIEHMAKVDSLFDSLKMQPRSDVKPFVWKTRPSSEAKVEYQAKKAGNAKQKGPKKGKW